ncbi:MAG: ABC transporter permease [Candidatus Heimdallarchaeota archaeon]
MSTKIKTFFKKIGSNIASFFKHLGHSFRRIGNHIGVSFREFSRSPVTILLLIVFPILLLLLFGSIFASEDLYSYHLEVQDYDNSSISELLIQKLIAEEILDVHRLSTGINPRVYLQQNDLHSCMVIPVNWAADSILDKANVTLIINPLSESARRVVDTVRQIILNFNFNQTSVEPIIEIDVVSFSQETTSYIDFFIPGVVGITIMLTGILGTINRQVNYNISGLFRKIATTPMTRWEYVSAEVIWQFLIAFFSTLLIILTAWAAFSFSWTSFSFLIIPIVIVGVMVFSGIGLIISQLVKNPNVAFAIGTLITIPMLFLSGVFFDISGVRAMVIISNFSPLTYVVEALRASMITGNYSLAGLYIGLGFVLGLISILIGVFLTKWDRD